MSVRTKRETAEERKSRKRPAAPIDAGPGTRLQKALAAAGIGSRRRCEELIEEGRVTVNGRVVNVLPAWVDPRDDVIAVEGLELPRAERLVYVMLYKPRATVSTLLDPDGRKTVADIVRHPSGARMYPVGRLDYETMGLLLLTNDGELANRLTHARYGISKTYRALVKASLTEESTKQLEARLHDQERRMTRSARGRAPTGAPGIVFSLVKSGEGKSVLDITITEGKTRPVKEMLAFLGLMVKKLVRVRVGPLRLRGVALGEWRELTRDELREVRVACGLLRAERPGAGTKGSGEPSKSGVKVKRVKPRVDEDGFGLILPGDPALADQGAGDDEFDGVSVW